MDFQGGVLLSWIFSTFCIRLAAGISCYVGSYDSQTWDNAIALQDNCLICEKISGIQIVNGEDQYTSLYSCVSTGLPCSMEYAYYLTRTDRWALRKCTCCSSRCNADPNMPSAQGYCPAHYLSNKTLDNGVRRGRIIGATSRRASWKGPCAWTCSWTSTTWSSWDDDPTCAWTCRFVGNYRRSSSTTLQKQFSPFFITSTLFLLFYI